MASLGRAQEYAARAYANRLADQSVLIARPDGLYQIGSQFEPWSKLRPKTRPGGHRCITYGPIAANSI